MKREIAQIREVARFSACKDILGSAISSARVEAPNTWFSLFHLRRAADVAGVSPVAVPALTCTDCGTVDPKVVRTQEQQLATN